MATRKNNHTKADYSNKKVVLVLSGGWVKGFAHLGILKGLEEMGIRPSLIVGTSIGAILGAYYCWNPDWKWVNSQVKKYPAKNMVSLLESLNLKKGILNSDALYKKFAESISNASFSDLKIPLQINATDIVSGKTVLFTSGKVVDAVRASSSVPILFSPFVKDGKMLVDGGLNENLCFHHLIPKARDYDLFILVSVAGRIRKYPKDSSVVGIGIQCISIMLKNQIETSLLLLQEDSSINADVFRNKMVFIAPKVPVISAMQFDKQDETMQKGYRSFVYARPKIESILGSGRHKAR